MATVPLPPKKIVHAFTVDRPFGDFLLICINDSGDIWQRVLSIDTATKLTDRLYVAGPWTTVTEKAE